jgi:hypothetical protein
MLYRRILIVITEEMEEIFNRENNTDSSNSPVNMFNQEKIINNRNSNPTREDCLTAAGSHRMVQ